MKNTIFTSFLLILALSVQAQQKFRVGFQAGLLANDQYSKTRFDIATAGPGPAYSAYYVNRQYPLPGYLVGITLQRSLTDRLAVGINFSWYQSSSVNKQEAVVQSNGLAQITRSQYRCQYFQVPVWLQYTQASLRLKPYARVGLAYTYLVKAHLTDTYTNAGATADAYTHEEDLPIAENGYIGLPRHDWQVMTEVGVSLSKRLRLGLRYDLLARKRSFIGAADGYFSFRNRNIGLVTEILF